MNPVALVYVKPDDAFTIRRTHHGKRVRYSVTSRRLLGVLSVAAVVGVLAAGCGGSGKSPSTAGSTPSAQPTSAAPGSSGGGGDQGTTVTVTETEFDLALSQTAFRPGTYTFVADNKGPSDARPGGRGPGRARQGHSVAVGRPDGAADRDIAEGDVRAVLPGGKPQGTRYGNPHHGGLMMTPTYPGHPMSVVGGVVTALSRGGLR